MFWRILYMLFGKKRKKLPISATEIIRRGPKAEEYIKWSRGKRIRVFDPPFWGIHDIFVDKDLVHTVFCLKHDYSAFVFTGDTEGARNLTQFDSNQKLLESKELLPEELSWKIYDDFVIYRGTLLPPTKNPYYWGKVISTQSFEENMTPEVLVKTLKTLLQEAQIPVKDEETI